ncbi:MAG: hypothetical protein IIA45_03170 [Bacteroidetes bacterium]|nr:hypothetical protein [Bacteroidota bacterium]
MFETNNPDELWDGTFRGSKSAIGVYAYLLTYRNNDKIMVKYGDVTLSR